VSAPADTNKETVYQVPHSAFSDIRAKARESGRAEAEREIADRLKAVGVSSLDELISKATAGSPSVAAPVTPPAAPPPEAGDKKVETPVKSGEALKKLLAAEKAVSDANAKAAEAEARAAKALKDAENARIEAQAHANMTILATKVGIVDTDYALTLLTRKVGAMSEAEAANFDPKAFFEGLRSEKPALFGTVPSGATTGAGAAPKPQDTPDKPKSALQMSPQELRVYRRSLGLN